MIGQVARRQVLLERAVGEGVDAYPARQQQPGPLAQVFHQARQAHVGVLVQAQQAAQQLAFLDIRRPRQIRLPGVRGVGQALQQSAHLAAVHPHPLRQAWLLHDHQVFVAHHLGALPPIQQQIDRVGIEFLAFLRQAAPAPGVQRRHQGEQQGAFRQFA